MLGMLKFRQSFTKRKIFLATLCLLILVIAGIRFNQLARTNQLKHIVADALAFNAENPKGLLVATESVYDDLVDVSISEGHSDIHWIASMPPNVQHMKIPKLMISKPFNCIPFITIHKLSVSKEWWEADMRFKLFINFAGSTIPAYTHHTHWSDDQ